MRVLQPLNYETRRLEGEGALPKEPLFHSPAAWTAPEALAKKDRWIYKLTDDDRAEIIAATKHAVATKKMVPVS